MKKLILLISLLFVFQMTAYAKDSHKNQEGKGHTDHGNGKGYGHCKDEWKVKCKKKLKRGKKYIKLCINPEGDIGEEEDDGDIKPKKDCTAGVVSTYYSNGVRKRLEQCYAEGSYSYNRGRRYQVVMNDEQGRIKKRITMGIRASGEVIHQSYDVEYSSDGTKSEDAHASTDDEIKLMESYIK